MEKKPNPTTNSSIEGLLLAGGKSFRMGTDKGMVLFKGKPLGKYSLEKLEKNCSKVCISTGSSEYIIWGKELVADVYEGKGPLGGIYSGLLACKSEYLMVLTCDMPFVTDEMIEQLIEECKGNQITLPRHGKYFEPLCAVYHKSLIESIRKQIEMGDNGPLTLLAASQVKTIAEDKNGNLLNPDIFRNINTVLDLRTYDPLSFPMKKYPKLALFCGSGRNVGKTLLASRVIKAFSKQYPIAAIKISPHHHDDPDNKLICGEEGKYRIFSEEASLHKDSSQFREAGAKPVFFIESYDEFLLEAFEKTMEIIGNEYYIVAESGSLARMVKPGILSFVQFEDEEKFTFPKNINRSLSDIVFKASRENVFESISAIHIPIFIHDGKWKLEGQNR